MNSDHAEIWFATQLRRHGITIFDGLTTLEQRRERARAGIIEKGIGDAVIGKRSGIKLTFGAVFAELYHEPLKLKEEAA